MSMDANSCNPASETLQEAETLLQELLPGEKQCFSRFLSPYLVASFGSFTRMDYGTGHETAFGILLLCLTLIRFFNPVPDEERALVFHVFLRYLRLCWKLQDVYRLEPAGSHGVWGLDDYSFLGYIFGSAQLRGGTNSVPKQTLTQCNRVQIKGTSLCQQCCNRRCLKIISISCQFRGSTSSSQVPFTNIPRNYMPLLQGCRIGPKSILDCSKCMRCVEPFSTLDSPDGCVEAEVLGKSVVVQHIPMGGLLEWQIEGPRTQDPVVDPLRTLKAPWATQAQAPSDPASSNMGLSSLPPTRAPWSK